MSAHLRETWAALGLEQYVSAAEHAMEGAGLAGKTIHVPTGHVDDPAYQRAIEPLRQQVSRWAGEDVKLFASDYQLDAEGHAQAMVTPMGSIVVRPVTNELTILHEVAHVLTRTREGAGGHTPEFCRVARDLYAKHIGQAAADQFWHVVSMHGDMTKRAVQAEKKYARVTAWWPTSDGGRKKAAVIGRWYRKGDTLIGERKDDDPKVEDGIIQHLMYVHINDVVKIEREDPQYETWVKAPDDWFGV